MLKYGAHAYARVRGQFLARTHNLPPVATVYAASSPKAGSQWVKALFDHPVVRTHSRLFTLPQLDFQSHPERGFPLASFVPGLYLSYPEYLRIPQPAEHRVIYVFRDPRDVVVSGYFSAVGTHRRMVAAGIEESRARLRQLPLDEGLLYAVSLAADRLREMASWVDVENPDVRKFRLEDIGNEPEVRVPEILEHVGIRLAPAELETVLDDVSRERLQARDLAQRSAGSESHYRVSRQGHRDLFSQDHYRAVERVVPGLAAQLGYDS